MPKPSTTAWNDRTGLSLAATSRARARAGLKAVADWAVRNQVRQGWPKWDANTGRFPYHVHLVTNEYFLSTSWNTARTVQGLLAAYQVLGDAAYLEAAERGLDYVKSLQVFTPEFPHARGAFIEETPLGDHTAARDGMECAQALLAHHAATGNRVSLQRAGAFLDWLDKEYHSRCWPMGYFYLTDARKPGTLTGNIRFIFSAGAIPLVQGAVFTGKRRYVTHVAVPMLEEMLEQHQRADGAFEYRAPGADHHVPIPGDPTVYNDDGVGVALLCAWRATGRKRYRDAAVAYGTWWLTRDLAALPPTYAMLPSLGIFMTDLARATGDAAYARFLDAIADRIFSLQILRDERPLVAGAFRGEDMAPRYRAGSDAGDFISLRSTSYGLIVLAKLAAGNVREWGPSYSMFGF
ncbi:MAG: hypothetical protein K8T26_17965 [Lentisphaerae bacterium]|nr:hypothetical protein [Lentisphaerota bacterium]